MGTIIDVKPKLIFSSTNSDNVRHKHSNETSKFRHTVVSKI